MKPLKVNPLNVKPLASLIVLKKFPILSAPPIGWTHVITQTVTIRTGDALLSNFATHYFVGANQATVGQVLPLPVLWLGRARKWHLPLAILISFSI